MKWCIKRSPYLRCFYTLIYRVAITILQKIAIAIYFMEPLSTGPRRHVIHAGHLAAMCPMRCVCEGLRRAPSRIWPLQKTPRAVERDVKTETDTNPPENSLGPQTYCDRDKPGSSESQDANFADLVDGYGFFQSTDCAYSWHCACPIDLRDMRQQRSSEK